MQSPCVTISVLAENTAATGVPSKGMFSSQYSIFDISPVGPSVIKGLVPWRVGMW
jgi:hypothetical protein